MKLLLSIVLLLASTYAYADSCRINGQPADCVITTPPTTPPTPPPQPNAGCAANFGGADLTWSPFLTTTLFPIPPTQTSGANGKAIKFVADSSISTYGLTIRVVDESGGNIALPKDVVIDQCPHVFTPSSPGCGAIGGITGFNINVLMSTSGTAATSNDCPLTANGTYYINFRATDKASPVQVQFGVSARAKTIFGF